MIKFIRQHDGAYFKANTLTDITQDVKKLVELQEKWRNNRKAFDTVQDGKVWDACEQNIINGIDWDSVDQTITEGGVFTANGLILLNI